jgi:hypothetical protein
MIDGTITYFLVPGQVRMKVGLNWLCFVKVEYEGVSP